ncbi:isoleucine--tRNA ligase [Ahrensia sp. 13_GOM-1096m]|uniref:isoleucine--tRNA ligase n=1 Tax=Ahrensia sp. 13_GOM-1096m TaxID=1380380 RepID=UPI00047DEDB5|nr:isoleucine--tRNA ligase [Ahrensia sp. 13_GOM-1096m]
MTDSADNKIDYSKTLNLPQTDFPMRAGLPKKEPEIIERWNEMNLYKSLREDAKGREKFVLHDGPPYANGNLHIGHALNKTLKDVITRSFQMRGYDSNYVPGWDCHGLPIEWKIEEQYRGKGKNKDEVPINEFRQECRDFAAHWVGVQSEEFLRLGITGDFENPYLTMNFDSEAIIAGELMKFAKSGQLYRGSKPIMWSVVEQTALAEAEIEYEIYESDTVWVKFPVLSVKQSITGFSIDEVQTQALRAHQLVGASVVIWTTTPWTIPANRCVCYSTKVSYGLYEVTVAENEFGPQVGDRLIFADSLVGECAEKAKVEMKRVGDVSVDDLKGMILDHPLKGMGVDGYQFKVPMLHGDHVTEDAGTGFVHTAPGHGRDDFENWIAKRAEIEALGIDSSIPFCVADDGTYTDDAPGFPDVKVIDEKGKKGKANQAVITALIGQNNLFARGRVKHEYPHSWRSKKPIIFRNTPQWFVYMDKDGVCEKGTLRNTALAAIEETRFVPALGKNRLRGMIEGRPDWVLSRQRAWGVPISVFRNEETGQVIPGPEFDKSDELSQRIVEAFKKEGADAWYAEGAKERFLDGIVDNQEQWTKVNDILDVWFDSGSTHAFCLEQREDLKWPADVYLEGSDQHRGWFHSSLLESAGTRGRAPYNAVITHGFTMAEDGRKMSKSLGNQMFPQDIIKKSGADILRLWVASTDYQEDQRIGEEILKTNIDSYRKLRNTLRWMLGTLSHDEGEEVSLADMPELERLMLHRIWELDKLVNNSYDNFDFKRITRGLLDFMVLELSAFYFDVRKDALYCDGPSSVRRKAALQVVGILFDRLVTWMAPILPFTMEETWLSRYPDAKSVHFEQFRSCPDEWRDDALAARWKKVRQVRRVVTGALEIERREKRIGSSLEAAPVVYINNDELNTAINGLDMEEICITSDIEISVGAAPDGAFTLDDVSGVAVVPQLAKGEKCARSWRVTTDVGADPEFPEVSARDAKVLQELKLLGKL